MQAAFSPSERMKTLITCGSVFHVKHKKPNGEKVEHYAFVCNSDPANDEYIILAAITSDHDDQFLPRLRKKLDPSTLVSIPAVAFRRLDHLSFVNCNLPIFRSLIKLSEEVVSGETIFFSPGLRNLIYVDLCLKGMLNSNTVSPKWKEYIVQKCKVPGHK